MSRSLFVVKLYNNQSTDTHMQLLVAVLNCKVSSVAARLIGCCVPWLAYLHVAYLHGVQGGLPLLATLTQRHIN